MECYSNLIQGRNNVQLFILGPLGLKADSQTPWSWPSILWLVWPWADHQKWTFKTCQQFQRSTQWHFNLKNYKQPHSHQQPCHVPRNVQRGGSEGAIEEEGSFKVPWPGQSLTVEIIFNAFKGTYFINILHIESIGLFLCIIFVHNNLSKAFQSPFSNDF